MKSSITNKSIANKSFAFIFSLLLLIILVGCNDTDKPNIADNSSALQSDDPATEATMPEPEKQTGRRSVQTPKHSILTAVSIIRNLSMYSIIFIQFLLDRACRIFSGSGRGSW